MSKIPVRMWVKNEFSTGARVEIKKSPSEDRSQLRLANNSSVSAISFCSFSDISLSINSCFILVINLISEKSRVTVFNKFPISRFLRFPVTAVLIIVLVDAIELEMRRIVRVLTSYKSLSSFSFLNNPWAREITISNSLETTNEIPTSLIYFLT